MKEMRVWSLRVFSTLVLSSRNLKDWLSFGIRLMLRELGCLVGHLWSQTSFVGGGQTKHVAGWNMDHQLAFLLFPVCVCVCDIYIYICLSSVHVYVYVCMHIFFILPYIYYDFYLDGSWIFQLHDGMVICRKGGKACPFFLSRNSLGKPRGFSPLIQVSSRIKWCRYHWVPHLSGEGC